MFRVTKIADRFVKCQQHLRKCSLDCSKLRSLVDIKADVYDALKTKGRAVVALESTIITHGMPYPHNLKTAIEVEEIVRNRGAIPATIAIINGRIKVGLTKAELEMLSNIEASNIGNTVKTSRRDMAYILSKNWNGGTTVAGTLIVANMIGIKVFATGGIGGVHRDGQNTLDVSADLVELGRTPVAVVSSGIKSILDIPRTMEYLETQGVFVASYKGENNDFPAFYTRSSGTKAPYNIETPLEAAKMIDVSSKLGLSSGFLIGVPVPKEFAMDENLINKAIADALSEAESKHVLGKEVTPFILAAVSKITKGRSLESNMALIKNNAKIAADIAVELNKVQSENSENFVKTSDVELKKVPVVIGGAIVDTCISVLDDNLKLDGATYNAKVDISAGGVARNIAEAILKIYGNVKLISSVGNDQNGQFIKRLLPKHCSDSIITAGSYPTANCAVLLDKFGDSKMVVGDMSVHNVISSEWIKEKADLIEGSPLVIIDANMPSQTNETIFELCKKYEKPVFLEPTDMKIAVNVFARTSRASQEVIKFISPNIHELREIAKHFGYDGPVTESAPTDFVDLKEVNQLATHVHKFVDNIIVTLGSVGVAILRTKSADDPFFCNKGLYIDEKGSGHGQLRFYPATKLENITNVSGAGDSFTSGFVSAMLDGKTEKICVNVAFAAAKCALQSKGAVAENYFERHHSCWNKMASFQLIEV